ncbi:MAG TPA: DUF4435 domain-containing protein, partial [Blastocatellia bacterium]|nr:DUF4435 domain-containing protein [Blastocatellia bacterium]
VIVLVEGDDDQYVLREWFSELRQEMEFYQCGGIGNLTKSLNELLTKGTLKHAYGITDRDFRDEAEVEGSYAEDSRLFILRRYALENYLLEPSPLWQLMKLWDDRIVSALSDEQALDIRLLEYCRQLKSLMAANWLFYEKNLAAQRDTGATAKLEYFSTGYDADRQGVVKGVAGRLQCTEAEADEQIAAKEREIERHLASIQSAHRVMDGKRLLHCLNQEYFKTDRNRLLRFLTDKAKSHELPADITRIVRERILAAATR